MRQAVAERGIKKDTVIVANNDSKLELIITNITDKEITATQTTDKRRRVTVSMQDVLDKYKIKPESDQVRAI